MSYSDPLPIGVIPEDINFKPKRMKAWVIRKDRHGEPTKSFQEEELPVPECGPNDVLVLVVATGVNFNGVWAGLGEPISVLDIHKEELHVAGSDCSGIVWDIGSNVKSWKKGDEVIIHCGVESEEPHSNMTQTIGDFISYDPMVSMQAQIWGYETPNGCFSQFTKVQAQQILKKPKHLNWEEAASYALCYFTAYRMLVTKANIQPGEVVLVWGAAGGLGVFALQICKMLGAKAIGVVSSEDKFKICEDLGAVGVINRKDFPNLAYKKNETEEETALRFKEMKNFGKKIWEILGERKSPNVIFEHPGETTFPASVFVCEKFGRIVICAGTSGYDCSFDVRYLWMLQKQILGSHFANALECIRANELVHQGLIKPVVSEVYSYEDIPKAHQLMYENKHSGKMVCLVQGSKDL